MDGESGNWESVYNPDTRDVSVVRMTYLFLLLGRACSRQVRIQKGKKKAFVCTWQVSFRSRALYRSICSGLTKMDCLSLAQEISGMEIFTCVDLFILNKLLQ